MTSAFWHPGQFARRKPHLEARGRVIAALRGYFAGEGFAEVETPALQLSPGGEVHLHAFATELKDPHSLAAKPLYLHTSPEFAMKKLLAAGMPKIFQLAHCFRNGERSSLHHPEFLMLEWYRSQKTEDRGQRTEEKLLDDVQQDCVVLTRAAAQAAGRKIFSFNGIACDPFKEWEKISVAEAFKRYADIDILAANETAQLAGEARRTGIRAGPEDAWEDLFFRIMGEKIEPHLGKDRPAILCDYPIRMASLARPKPGHPELAERFEIYICGVELANGFGELTDADEQARRLKTDMALKHKLYGESWPVDEDFIAALRSGMPDSAGVALGADRLAMLCVGAAHIEDVLWAPVVE